MPINPPSPDELVMAQGNVKPATDADIEKDIEGITKPNLHRRINEDLTVLTDYEVAPDIHSLQVGGVNSYRGTQHYYYAPVIDKSLTETFIGDGVKKSFILQEVPEGNKIATITQIISITINGSTATESEYSLDKQTNTVTFILAPVDNAEIIITYKMISEIP